MRILYVFRSPVGGLFRHVLDLVRGQKDSGHEIGLFCDSLTGGATGDRLLREIAPFCSLGITRYAMPRLPGFADFGAIVKTRQLVKDLKINVVHCHGAKGGLYGRLAARSLGIASVYTPHGGSLYFEWRDLRGAVYLATECLLRQTGNAYTFVCEYEKNQVARKIGLGNSKHLLAHNGLWPEEFNVPIQDAGASDIIFVGEMSYKKGVDSLLNAIALLKSRRVVTATMIGDGPDMQEFQTLVQTLGIAPQVKFLGRKTMTEALKLGRVFVLPSRHESFPYVVLEAVAACMPIISSNVGGVSEILPQDMMFKAGDDAALADMIVERLDHTDRAKQKAKALNDVVRANFSATDMVNRVSAFYETLI